MKPQDVQLTCPALWNIQGEKETLECAITEARFTSPAPCVYRNDIVQFEMTEANGVKSVECTVHSLDTVCNGIPNSDGCACTEKTGGKIILQYNITAVKADHEGARWRCLLQCFEADTTTRPLTQSNTTECFYTMFGEQLFCLYVCLFFPFFFVVVVL